ATRRAQAPTPPTPRHTPHRDAARPNRPRVEARPEKATARAPRNATGKATPGKATGKATPDKATDKATPDRGIRAEAVRASPDPTGLSRSRAAFPAPSRSLIASHRHVSSPGSPTPPTIGPPGLPRSPR